MNTEKTALPALAAGLCLLLLSACKAPSLGISFCKLTNQLAEEDRRFFKETNHRELPPGVLCIQVYHSRVPFCRQLISGDEPVMDEALAFDSMCDEPAVGFQHFYFFAIEHAPERAGEAPFTGYHFLSFYEKQKGAQLPPPGSDVDVLAVNEATLYSGTYCPAGYVRMHHRSVYAKKRRGQSAFNGNNAKPSGRHATDQEFWVTCAMDTLAGGIVHRKICSLDRIVRRTRNDISGDKPLVFTFNGTLGVPNIPFKEKPVFTCSQGPLCADGPGIWPMDWGAGGRH